MNHRACRASWKLRAGGEGDLRQQLVQVRPDVFRRRQVSAVPDAYALDYVLQAVQEFGLRRGEVLRAEPLGDVLRIGVQTLPEHFVIAKG